MLDHDQLTRRASRWLEGSQRCAVVLVEPIAWSSREVPDAIGFMPNGHSVVVECKTSRIDFLGDKLKTHRRLGRDERFPHCQSMGRERWYLIEDRSIIRDGDELFGWGVLHLRGSRVFKAVEPTLDPRPISPDLPAIVAVLRRERAICRNRR